MFKDVVATALIIGLLAPLLAGLFGLTIYFISLAIHDVIDMWRHHEN